MTACIKPPKPEQITAPVPTRGPTFAMGPTFTLGLLAVDGAIHGEPTTQVAFAQAKNAADLAEVSFRAATSSVGVRRERNAVIRELDQAIAAASDASEKTALKQRRQKVLSSAKKRIRELDDEQSRVNAESQDPPREMPSLLDQVLAARAVPLDTLDLLETALGNDLIPPDLKAELPSAMAKVQAVSPHAPGISVEIIAGREFGRASRGTVWASTVSGGGQVHGFAYEVIAASRFIDEKKTPGGGGRPLRIVEGVDSLIFGQKLPAAPGRRSIEADILIVKAGGRKIALDVKNYAHAFSGPGSLASQLNGIKESIRQGEIHDFRFVVRGEITSGVKLAIEQADREIRAEMNKVLAEEEPTLSELQARSVDLSRPVITWHENLG